MSNEDDIRSRLAQSQQRTTMRTQFDELARLGHWKDAAKLSEQLDGNAPTDKIVSLDDARARQ